jgi:hypothetical protein
MPRSPDHRITRSFLSSVLSVHSTFFDKLGTVAKIETVSAPGFHLGAFQCRSGGIGRRAWFRSMYPQGCGGSSPFFGTNSFLGTWEPACAGSCSECPGARHCRAAPSQGEPRPGAPFLISGSTWRSTRVASLVLSLFPGRVLLILQRHQSSKRRECCSGKVPKRQHAHRSSSLTTF